VYSAPNRPAKFHHPTFNGSEGIVRTNRQTNTLTNKQTPLKTSTSLRYATPVGNQYYCLAVCSMQITTLRSDERRDEIITFEFHKNVDSLSTTELVGGVDGPLTGRWSVRANDRQLIGIK